MLCLGIFLFFPKIPGIIRILEGNVKIYQKAGRGDKDEDPILTVLTVTAVGKQCGNYNISGHYLCFEGYADDTSSGGHTVYVVDLWLRVHHIASGKYAVSREKLYAVTDRIGS